ncbi:MAG: hypothetical protein EOP84_04530 [Verrucomicrobiaceae bacterium]|nr:MAG: hypothetical protein EOP84_04530 [Verrucomicrobiaceae bacterium]
MTIDAGAVPHELAAAYFDALAIAAVSILKSNSEPAFLANPYLHPRNTHPATLSVYEPFLARQAEPSSFLSSVLSGVHALVNSVCDRGIRDLRDQVRGPVHFLFVSHLLRPEQLQTGQDIYYADLPYTLAKSGLSSGVALIDHTGIAPAVLEPHWAAQGVPRFLLPRTMSFHEELGYSIALSRAGRRLRHWKSGDVDQDAVAQRAAAHASSGAARAALRIGNQLAKLVEHTGARILVMTYEGHAWERLAMLLARRVRPDLVCVCYSHAVLFPKPHAMTASLGPSMDPAVILTPGSITRDKLTKLVHMADTSVDVLGSVRRGHALSAHDRPARCLILPEGLVSECLPLISVALEAARLLPDVSFMIRLHPILSKNELLEAAPHFHLLPANVEWSAQAPLVEDLSASRWMLYRGSSAVFQGVEAGLKPFYLDLPQDLSPIDPLLGLAVWRSRITSGRELAAALRSPVDIAADKADLAVARSYCEDYFAPLNPSILVDIAKATLGKEA